MAAAGWVAAAAVYLAWNRVLTPGTDAARTASHATREDPRIASDVLVLPASTAGPAGVVVLLARSGSRGGAQDAGAGLGLCSAAASWLVVHTTCTLRYASEVRATILRQALLSSLLGAVVLAATIDLVVDLGTSRS